MIASTVSFSCAVFLLVATVSGAALAVGGGPKAAADQPTQISGLSPYSDGGDPNDPLAVTECNGAPQTGVVPLDLQPFQSLALVGQRRQILVHRTRNRAQ